MTSKDQFWYFDSESSRNPFTQRVQSSSDDRQINDHGCELLSFKYIHPPQTKMKYFPFSCQFLAFLSLRIHIHMMFRSVDSGSRLDGSQRTTGKQRTHASCALHILLWLTRAIAHCTTTTIMITPRNYYRQAEDPCQLCAAHHPLLWPTVRTITITLSNKRALASSGPARVLYCTMYSTQLGHPPLNDN